jgi:hypothetical protein
MKAKYLNGHAYLLHLTTGIIYITTQFELLLRQWNGLHFSVSLFCNLNFPELISTLVLNLRFSVCHCVCDKVIC